MKQIPLTILMVLACSNLFAQQKKEPPEEPFKIEKDTMYAMVDHEGTIKNLVGMPYLRKWWPENGKYKEYLFNAETNKLVRIAWYKDKACKEKDGLLETYHSNGMAKDSGRYENNKREGQFAGWYEEGMQHYRKQYRNGLPVDTGYVFRDNGTLATLTITDQNGNGIQQEYFENQKVKLIGRLKEGNRDAKWILKREDGTKMMELNYMMDSLAQTTCFEADGSTLAKGDCIYEKPAEFPGGNQGWAKFLEKYLVYPTYAVNKNIQGVVRIQFIVSKDGSISEFTILNSPDKSLSGEVLRLMKKSPKWQPAIQYNQPVIFRHVQAITFKLE
jgi:TonB family protein